jgi:hypothetical protein
MPLTDCSSRASRNIPTKMAILLMSSHLTPLGKLLDEKRVFNRYLVLWRIDGLIGLG